MADSIGWVDLLGSFALEMEYRVNKDAGMDSQTHESWVLTRLVLNDSPFQFYGVRGHCFWRINPEAGELYDSSDVKLFRGTMSSAEGFEPAFEVDWNRRYCPPGPKGCAAMVFPEDFGLAAMLIDVPFSPESARAQAEGFIGRYIEITKYSYYDSQDLEVEKPNESEGILGRKDFKPKQKRTVRSLIRPVTDLGNGRTYTYCCGLELQWLRYEDDSQRVVAWKSIELPSGHQRFDDWEQVGKLNREVETDWTWIDGKDGRVLVPEKLRRRTNGVFPTGSKVPADVSRSTMKLVWKPLPKNPPEFQDKFDYVSDYKAMLRKAKEKIGP